MSIPKKERFKQLNANKYIDDIECFSYKERAFSNLGKSPKTDLKDELNLPNTEQYVMSDEKGYLYEVVVQNKEEKLLIVGIKTIPEK